MQKHLIWVLVLFSTLFNASLVYAGSPNVVGSWRVTYYLEPGRSTGATQCIVFKSVPGTVAGVPTSGTWTSPSFPGWFGEWIQLGDHVRWFGLTSSLATTTSGNVEHGNLFGGVSFNHYNKSTGKTSTAGSWRAVRVSSCGSLDHPVDVNGDPADIANTMSNE